MFACLEGPIEEFHSEVYMELRCLIINKSNICEEGRV